jgi:hypothetical protein
METERFAQKFGDKHGFDPAMIIALIQSIMAAFQNCPQNPTSIRGTVKNPGPFQKAKATRIIMQELDGVSRSRARQIAEDLMHEAATSDDTVIDSVAEECCDPSRW